MGPIGVALHSDVVIEVYVLPGRVTVDPAPGWVTYDVWIDVTVVTRPGCVM